MLAIDDSASSFCAREMRGTLSIASTVAFVAASCCISSGFCAGQMKLTSVCPRASAPTSAVLGARTLKTMSALAQIVASATISAPAARYVSSAKFAASPAPDSTATREAELDQLLDDFGDGGDALLARRGFARHSNQLRHGSFVEVAAIVRNLRRS